MSNIPVNDFFEHINLDEPGDIEEALDNLIHDLESDYFLLWEAVLREEQGVKLSKEEKKLRDLSRERESSEQFVWRNRRYGETETQLSRSAITPSVRVKMK